jgi:hypothetical protein
MLPNTVFGFISKNGANFIGTTIHSAQCWPLTFDQKLKEQDKRTLIHFKGPPTLYVKTIKKNNKSIFTTAFRNGTDSVSTAISSVQDLSGRKILLQLINNKIQFGLSCLPANMFSVLKLVCMYHVWFMSDTMQLPPLV